MGILNWWKRASTRDHPSSLKDPVLQAIWGARDSISGVDVTPDTAMDSTAVIAALRILSEGVAMPPLDTFERITLDTGRSAKRRALEHPLYFLLKDEPNPEMTSFELREMIQGNCTLHGNGYAEVVRDGGGRVREIWPMRSDWMTPFREKSGELKYLYRPPDGRQIVFKAENILHIPGFHTGGLEGMSAINLGREAIGVALATDRHAAGIFKRGIVPGLVLEHPEVLGPEAQKNLRRSFEEAYSGSDKSYRAMILEQGLKLNNGGVVDPERTQLLESRQFSISDMGRIFGIQPTRLGDLSHATFTNIEHLAIEFTQWTIGPWLERWCQRLKKDLLSPREKRQYFMEFNLSALLKGDYKTRQEGYQIGRNGGWLSANDIREMENLNPLPDDSGDMYLVPLNMVDAASAIAGSAPSDTDTETQNEDDG